MALYRLLSLLMWLFILTTPAFAQEAPLFGEPGFRDSGDILDTLHRAQAPTGTRHELFSPQSSFALSPET